VPIQCRSNANTVPIHANQMSIERQSSTNPLPI
jgi:hypothetical protein